MLGAFLFCQVCTGFVKVFDLASFPHPFHFNSCYRLCLCPYAVRVGLLENNNGGGGILKAVSTTAVLESFRENWLVT